MALSEQCLVIEKKRLGDEARSQRVRHERALPQ
jgi:hypothetical protein